MYAVVHTGGKQLKVEQGSVETVERLDAAVGDTVQLSPLFVSDGEKIVVDSAGLAGASVAAEVVEHKLGDKALIFKFKKRKGYKRLRGHRQELTVLRVTDISLGEAPKKKTTTKKAAPKKTAEPVVESEAVVDTAAPAESAE